MILYNYKPSEASIYHSAFEGIHFDVYGDVRPFADDDRTIQSEFYEDRGQSLYFIESYPKGSAYSKFRCKRCGTTYYTSPSISANQMRCDRCAGATAKSKDVIYLTQVPCLPEHIWGEIPLYWGLNDDILVQSLSSNRRSDQQEGVVPLPDGEQCDSDRQEC